VSTIPASPDVEKPTVGGKYTIREIIPDASIVDAAFKAEPAVYLEEILRLNHPFSLNTELPYYHWRFRPLNQSDVETYVRNKVKA
jgi:hypothetical protein